MIFFGYLSVKLIHTMKKIFLLLLLIAFVSSCKSKQNTAESQKIKETNCPENNTCSTKLLKESTMVIVQDGTNKPFYTIAEQEGTTVYHYTRSEKKDERYQDGGYSEEIIFELPSNFKDGEISGAALLKTNALFGVFCYCKGKAGYYKISEGKISKKGNTFTIEIPEIVEGQRIKKLEIKF